MASIVEESHGTPHQRRQPKQNWIVEGKNAGTAVRKFFRVVLARKTYRSVERSCSASFLEAAENAKKRSVAAIGKAFSIQPLQ
jgi:hypothetical protein